MAGRKGKGLGAVARHAGRARAQLQDSCRKLAWRLRNGPVAETTPIFIIGSQRSGTGMLGQVLGKSPEIENLGESDPRAFDKYFIRDDRTIASLIERCKCRFLVFKPLKDSDRILDFLGRYPHARALWAYRYYPDRINSAVKEFGRHPLDVFASFVGGRSDAWQMRGVTPQVADVVRKYGSSDLTPHEGAALMWWVRNSLYFSLNLGAESRIRLWSYDAFVRDPARGLASLLEFIGARSFPYMLADVHAESFRKDAEPQLRAEIRAMCQELYDRLEGASARQSSE